MLDENGIHAALWEEKERDGIDHLARHRRIIRDLDKVAGRRPTAESGLLRPAALAVPHLALVEGGHRGIEYVLLIVQWYASSAWQPYRQYVNERTERQQTVMQISEGGTRRGI